MIRIGELREQLVLQCRALGTPDQYGGRTEEWTDVEAIYASVEEIGSTEGVVTKTMNVDMNLLVTHRFTLNANAAARYRWGARYLYPTSVIANAWRTMQTVTCRETVQ